MYNIAYKYCNINKNLATNLELDFKIIIGIIIKHLYNIFYFYSKK